jgi:hypothetical protein
VLLYCRELKCFKVVIVNFCIIRVAIIRGVVNVIVATVTIVTSKCKGLMPRVQVKAGAGQGGTNITTLVPPRTS